jgi:CRISPR-associated protein Cas5h
MKGLIFEMEAPYFCCFRKPATTSVILTYPIPPFTTIRGFLANCLGLGQFPKHVEYLSLQNGIKIGIQRLEVKGISRELCKILKLKKTGEGFKRVFPSSPMFKNYLIGPKYRIYIDGESNIESLFESLKDPERPLYLGQSDDMVDVTNVKVMDIEKTKSKEIHSVIKGVQENCEIVKLPYKFSKDGKSLEELTVSIPKKYPLALDKEVECCRFGEEYIIAY